MPICQFYGDDVINPPMMATVVESGEGDIGFATMSSDTHVVLGMFLLPEAVGTGNPSPKGFLETAPSDVMLSFPKESVNALDVLITALQNMRQQYYGDVPQSITREMNFIRPMTSDGVAQG